MKEESPYGTDNRCLQWGECQGGSIGNIDTALRIGSNGFYFAKEIFDGQRLILAYDQYLLQR